jgi:hypothetical protein
MVSMPAVWTSPGGSSLVRPVYTKDFDADGVRRGLYEASKVRTPEWRGTSNSPGSFTAPA